MIEYAGIVMPPLPFMELHEIEAMYLFLNIFDTPVQTFEWGSGASTFYFGSRLPQGSHWHSIEHDKAWYEQTSNEAKRWGADRIQVSYVPSDKPWQDSDGEGDAESFRSYILFPQTLEKTFDLILVDGRSRIFCMAVAWSLLADDGVMILHDAERPEYMPGIPPECYFLKLSALSIRPNASYNVDLLFMAKTPERLVRLERKLRRTLPQEVSIHSNLPTSNPKGRILFLNSYYQGFLNQLYRSNPGMEELPYYWQKRLAIDSCFGDSDFYSNGMEACGWEAEDLIINGSNLQSAWAREKGFSFKDSNAVLLEQIRNYRPDVLYLQDLALASESFFAAVRPFVGLIIGQIASPVPENAHMSGFDIVISSFSHFVERFRQSGITAYYQPLAFESKVLGRLPQLCREVPLSFVGGISPFHGNGLVQLEKICSGIPVDIWGYGSETLPPDSPLQLHHHGEIWGLQMFSKLVSSRITLNRHIDVAEGCANNMRLFEATGCGALLLTDYCDNLGELFEVGSEVVAYRTPEEAVLLARYYQQHPDEAAAIARAGQDRTLREHTYIRRMRQTAEIMEYHLRRWK